MMNVILHTQKKLMLLILSCWVVVAQPHSRTAWAQSQAPSLSLSPSVSVDTAASTHAKSIKSAESVKKAALDAEWGEEPSEQGSMAEDVAEVVAEVVDRTTEVAEKGSEIADMVNRLKKGEAAGETHLSAMLAPLAFAAIPVHMLTTWMRLNDKDVGTITPIVALIHYYSLAMIWAGMVIPGTATELVGADGKRRGPSVKILSTMYTIDQNKKSALTGKLQRSPSGKGRGYDIDLQMYLLSGLFIGGSSIFQTTQIDSTKWGSLNSWFSKKDFSLGLDVASSLGDLTGIAWFYDQSLWARWGKSYFGSQLILNDEGSGSLSPFDARINKSVELLQGSGYEVAAGARIYIPYVGSIEAAYSKGTYGDLSFPKINADDATFLVLVGFDDLRSGSSYTWERKSIQLDIPFIGFGPGGSIALGTQLNRLENNIGSGVDNRGYTLSVKGVY